MLCRRENASFYTLPLGRGFLEDGGQQAMNVVRHLRPGKEFLVALWARRPRTMPTPTALNHVRRKTVRTCRFRQANGRAEKRVCRASVLMICMTRLTPWVRVVEEG